MAQTAWGQLRLAQPRLFSVLWQLPLHCAQRMFASQTEGELKVTQILKENFPRATAIKVTDISGKVLIFPMEFGRILPSEGIEGRGLDGGNLPSWLPNICRFWADVEVGDTGTSKESMCGDEVLLSRPGLWLSH